MTPKFDKLVEGFFPDEDSIEFAGLYRVACNAAAAGEPLNKIERRIRIMIGDLSDADDSEIAAWVDKIIKRVQKNRECWPRS